MKDIKYLGSDLDKLTHKIEQRLIKAQSKTADKIKDDVIKNTGFGSGKYIDSIKRTDTELKGNIIETSIYTDLKSTDGYYIGRMIENGTGIYALEPHIGHTKTFFESQFNYWYVPKDLADRPIGKLIEIDGREFYVAKAQKPKPHWKPALDSNIELYKKNVKQALGGLK